MKKGGEKSGEKRERKRETDALLAPATFNDLPLAKLSNDSFLLSVQFFQW